MIKTYKVMLKPNNKQKTKLFECAGVSRWAYNWALGRQKENYENGGKFLSNGVLRKELTQLKKTEEYIWLNKYSNNITKQAIKDACDSYKRFFKGYSKFPKFKSRKRTKPSFYQDTEKIKVSKTHIKLEKLTSSRRKNRKKFNWIRLVEKDRVPIGEHVKYINPRITFDGLNWWISVGVECEDIEDIPNSEGIGIDLGIKDLAICSDDNTYKNINKTKEVKRLKKKTERLQRKVSRKYDMNKIKLKGGGSRYRKTSNIKKLERELLCVIKRLTNIRHNYIHQTTSEIINRKPIFIALEDLNVVGMMKNKHLSKAIQEQCLYEFYRQIQYKSQWNNIKFIEVDRWFPSSKMCSVCGTINDKLKLSDRIYDCDCGNSIDRDLNASINLRNYGLKLVE